MDKPKRLLLVSLIVPFLCTPVDAGLSNQNTKVVLNDAFSVRLQTDIRSTTFETDAEEVSNSKNAIAEYIKYSNISSETLSIDRSKRIHDFASNPYELYEFSDGGYVIYDCTAKTSSELSAACRSPFAGLDGEFLYVPMTGYYQVTDEGIVDIHSNRIVPIEIQNNLIAKSSLIGLSAKELAQEAALIQDDGPILQSKQIVPPGDLEPVAPHTADHEVNHSWYFKNNINQFASDHSFHSSGDCGYVALGLLFVYHELFSSKGYFSPDESSRYIRITNANPNIQRIVPTVNDLLIRHLVELFSTSYQTATMLKIIASRFLSGKAVDFSHTLPLGVAHRSITRRIDSNNPVILCGDLDYRCAGYDDSGFHDVVLYGYYDDDTHKYLAHFGWPNRSQVVVTNYSLSSLYVLENENLHIHNDLYYFDGAYYCACGYRW